MHPKLRKTGKVILALMLAASGIAAIPEAILFLTAFAQIGDTPESERAEVYDRLWKIVYKHIPEFSAEDLKEDKFDPKMINAKAHRMMMFQIMMTLQKDKSLQFQMTIVQAYLLQ